MATGTAKRYSDSLPADARGKVVRILARHADEFRTNTFYDEETGSSAWQQAKKDRETGLWRVTQFTTAPGIYYDGKTGEPSYIPRTVMAGVCFFDALYACAEFETGRLQNDAAILGNPGQKHYRMVAAAEGIAFNQKDDMPIPVADGEIIAGDGAVISRAGLDNLDRARGNLAPAKALQPIKAGDFLGNVSSGAGEVTGATPDDVIGTFDLAIRRQGDIRNVARVYDRREDAIQKTADDFKVFTDAKGRGLSVTAGRHGEGMPVILNSGGAALTVGAFAVGTLLTPVLGGIIAIPAVMAMCLGGLGSMIGGWFMFMDWIDEGPSPYQAYKKYGFVRPRRRFEKNIARMKAESEKLPDGEMKHAYRKFIAQSDLGLHAMAARHSYKRAEKNKFLTGRFARAAMERDLEALKTKAREYGPDYGITDDGLAQLLLAIRRNPDSDDFEINLTHSFQREARSFISAMRNVKENEVRSLMALPSYGAK